MQFINLHLDQTPDNKYVVTDNVSSLRGEGETPETAIGNYIFKAFCGAPSQAVFSSIDPGFYQNIPDINASGILDLQTKGQQGYICEHEWYTVGGAGRDNKDWQALKRECFKCGLIQGQQ